MIELAGLPKKVIAYLKLLLRVGYFALRGEVVFVRWRAKAFDLLLSLMVLASLILASGAGGKWR